MIRKLLVCPWFGPLPEWFEHWERNVATLERYGYDVLVTTDLPAFKQRVADILGVDCPIAEGSGKIHDYRCTFGMLYADELRGYDFWGHTDFDCVYGKIDNFLPDGQLKMVDLFSNHPTYVSGPWSLYRNTPVVNELFKTVPNWEGYLAFPETNGWVETMFSVAAALAPISRRYENYQTRNAHDFSTLHFDGDRLLEGDHEIMVAHFRHRKIYPEGCR